MLQLVQTVLEEHVVHPGIKVEQGEQVETSSAYPELQMQEEPLRVKYPAVLQLEQDVLEEQVAHPTIKESQVEQVPRLTAYPLWQVLQVVVEEHVAQLDRKAVQTVQMLLLRV